ncbi:MAG: sigma-70 family RNA polymerase sigma factor [Flavobacteriia bacterium]|nr:sigma-70 family RNA polymerase sigma factor [Flavobacteriia bacterium]
MFGRQKTYHDKKSEISKENFENIFNTYKSFVLAIAMRYLRCKDDANDVVQETFLNVYLNYSKYDTEKPIIPWIKKIAINTSLLYIRKNYRLQLFENEFDVIPEVHPFSNDFDEIIFPVEQMISILQNLPDGYRVVFSLYAIEGLNHKEIAEYLEISESTSRTQLFKARKMLKKIVETKMILFHERA